MSRRRPASSLRYLGSASAGGGARPVAEWPPAPKRVAQPFPNPESLTGMLVEPVGKPGPVVEVEVQVITAVEIGDRGPHGVASLDQP